MEPLYTAVATADAGRDGSVRAASGNLTVGLDKPPGMGGREGATGTNPEELFACGYAACFHGAMLFLARQDRLDVTGSSVTAEVTIGRGEDGFGLSVLLRASLPHLDAETAHALVERTHTTCPYSKATAGNIDVALEVEAS